VVGQGLSRLGSVASVGISIAAVVCSVLLIRVPASSQAPPATEKASTTTARLPDLIFVQAPQVAEGRLSQRFPQGSSIVRFSSPVQPRNTVHLTEGIFAAADPQISFDGTQVLFSGRKRQSDHWQLWEMDINGGEKRQITKCSQDCLRGAYLPAQEIAVTVEETTGKQTVSYLAVLNADGSDFRRITFGNASFRLETVLRDGRIVASAAWPLVATETSSRARILYTLRPDGTALESFRCDHKEKAIQTEAEELTDGSLIFVRAALTGSATGGELARIGQGDLQVTLLGPRATANVYESAGQISDNELVVAKQSAADKGPNAKFDLYLFNLKTAALGERVYADPQLSSIQPVIVAPRTVPKHYWNTLDPQSPTGNFISLNSYLSADAPDGRIATGISRVRVFALNATDGTERSLGEAPVEQDGSFFVQVPANCPVRFVLLDAKGQTIREEHSWIWTRPGEERGCTGCHGDKAMAPDNHWPLTLRRFDTPIALGDMNHGSATTPAK
jgi:Hydrazine synthase alpha subunit middle domain